MPNYHTYIISSLPFLQFGHKAPMAFERFLEICKDLVSHDEFLILKDSKNITDGKIKDRVKAGSIMQVWHDFEFLLRNQLVNIRAKRLHKNADKYLRGRFDTDPSFTHKVGEIARQPQPLEVERSLDAMRWNKLEELCFGHYFDKEFLFIYGQKLLILNRWDKIHSANKQKLFDGLMEKVEPHA